MQGMIKIYFLHMIIWFNIYSWFFLKNPQETRNRKELTQSKKWHLQKYIKPTSYSMFKDWKLSSKIRNKIPLLFKIILKILTSEVRWEKERHKKMTGKKQNDLRWCDCLYRKSQRNYRMLLELISDHLELYLRLDTTQSLLW